MSSFIKKLKDNEFAAELINAEDFLAYPTSDCYVSPLEVCWFDWKKEHNSSLEYGNNVLYKNVAKCTCDIQEKGETEYEMPSKKVRKIMGIISGDGYHYYNNEGLRLQITEMLVNVTAIVSICFLSIKKSLFQKQQN